MQTDAESVGLLAYDLTTVLAQEHIVGFPARRDVGRRDNLKTKYTYINAYLKDRCDSHKSVQKKEWNAELFSASHSFGHAL